MKYKNQKEFEKINRFGMGMPNEMFSEFFIGNSFLNPLTKPGEWTVFLANATFELGCRNNWHIHHKGVQILLCTADTGWYREEGKPAQSPKPGEVVYIPAEVNHWYGAAKDNWFSHIALSIPIEGGKVEWLNPVSGAEYNKINN